MTLGTAPTQGDLFRSTVAFCQGRVAEGSIYSVLHRECFNLFPDEMFADLFTDVGRRSVPPMIVATVMVLQRVEGLSDREAVERFAFDARWKYAAGGLDFDFPGFVHTVLVDMRARLAASDRPDRIFEVTLAAAAAAGLIGRKRVLDSTALYDAVATMDTMTLIRSAIRGLLRVAGEELEPRLRAVLIRDDDYRSAGKPVCDYDDPAAREALVDALAKDARALLLVLEGSTWPAGVEQAGRLLARVVGQDLDEGADGVFRVARRVTKDRVISTVDPEARHGHKTAARGFDGYKGHVGIDPDVEIITGTTATAGNVGDADAAMTLLAGDLPGRTGPHEPARDEPVNAQPAGDDCEGRDSGEGADSREPGGGDSDADSLEVYGDAAYGAGELQEQFANRNVANRCKVQPASPPQGGFFSKDEFDVDLETGTVTCPAGQRVPIRPARGGGGTAEFGRLCRSCPLAGVSDRLCKQSRRESEHMTDSTEQVEEPSTPFGEPAASEQTAARQAVEAMVQAGLLDRVLAQADAGELRLTGEGGFLPEMVKRVLEAGLAAELTGHLGYEKHDPAGRGSGNSRNGSTPKQLGTEIGDLELATPRDRNGTFDPRLVGKGQRRVSGLSEMIISLYAKGMTVRDIQHHLQSTLGTELSHETISNITEAVAAEVKAWQARPLEAVYPIVYLDALVVKVRDGHQVRNKAAHIAIGVDTDGVKHVLGIWVQSVEGAKFWAGALAELANRGVRDVLIVCCDGLTGFPEAIEATWPHAVVQTCTVHLIRASLRFVPESDRKAVAAALRQVYTAATAAAAATELDIVEGSAWGTKYPAMVKVWREAWERFIPFLEFPPALRRIIYTTNSIESLNYQLRKIIKNRGHFPNDDAVIKLLWLAIRDIEDKRAAERAKEAGRPKGVPRKAPPRLVEGAQVQHWNQALGALTLAFPGRLEQAV